MFCCLKNNKKYLSFFVLLDIVWTVYFVIYTMEKLKLDKVVRENGFEINFYRYFEKNKEVSDYLREKQIIKKEEDTDDFLWFFKEFKKRLDLPIEVYDDYYISSMIDYVVSFYDWTLSIMI